MYHLFLERLRLQLLAAWTDSVKRMGQRLICFMLLVFKPDYSDGEVRCRRRNIIIACRLLVCSDEVDEEHWRL